MCVVVSQCLYRCVHACVEGRGWRLLSSSIALHLIFETGSLTETGAHWLSGWMSSEIVIEIILSTSQDSMCTSGRYIFMCKLWIQTNTCTASSPTPEHLPLLDCGALSNSPGLQGLDRKWAICASGLQPLSHFTDYRTWWFQNGENQFLTLSLVVSPIV